VHTIVAASSIFTDEYNNSLDNPQFLEDAFPFIFTPLRYFAFRYKLVGFFQDISVLSADELATLYHFPDINYNKSPIIEWLDYKKLPTPHNLKYPNDPCIIEEKVKIGEQKEVQEGKEVLVPQYGMKKIHRHL
jgi:hypothetical protein